MLTINTNINNLKLQRNLNTVNSAMGKALERLSTGYRINNASDDAAGLVISTALGVQSRGLTVANQNAQMAVNVLGVADGALGQLGELTMRIRDLATQAANGGYLSVERKALELEAKELTSSLEQLVKGTKFNEFKVFEGTTSKGIISEADAIAQGYTVVKTAAELQAIAAGNLSGKYILMNDIDLSSIANWNAIGTSANRFAGTFDGNGFTISNLKIDKITDRQGLFGQTSGATIKNIRLESVDVKGGQFTGGLVGYAYNGTNISDCSVSGNIAGTDFIGGFVGYAYGDTNISNCSVSCNVEGTGTTDTGGFAGLASGTISNSYATGNVTGTGNWTGGFVGRTSDSSIISNSYATGNVTGVTDTGGFVGRANTGTFSNCYAAGNVTGTDGTGGFAGYVGSGGATTNCYFSGQNLATIGVRGGFIGYAYSGMIYANNNFITQIGGFGATGYGSASNITKQSASYFTPALAQSTLEAGSGAGMWDFSGPTPKLKWQIKPPFQNNILTFQIGTDGSNLSAISIDTSFSLDDFSASFADADAARATMIKCDELLKQINTKRGEIGASSNIFTSITDSNTVANENLTASKSRIMDADIARESANMIKNQILENATTALLAQTKNVNGDLALALLNGIRR